MEDITIGVGAKIPLSFKDFIECWLRENLTEDDERIFLTVASHD